MKTCYRSERHRKFQKSRAKRILRRRRRLYKRSKKVRSANQIRVYATQDLHKVTRIKDLKIILSDFELVVKDPRFLRVGRDFSNFKLRPREAWANWLLCVIGNFEAGDDDLTFSTDPTGGDGLIVSKKTGKLMRTEHVFSPAQNIKDLTSAEQQIEIAIAHKIKRGRDYAKGKQLVVFSEAVGSWTPNRLAKKLVGTHYFDSIWVVALRSSGDSGYDYTVSEMQLIGDFAPIWEVKITSLFNSWQVVRVQ